MSFPRQPMQSQEKQNTLLTLSELLNYFPIDTEEQVLYLNLHNNFRRQGLHPEATKHVFDSQNYKNLLSFLAYDDEALIGIDYKEIRFLLSSQRQLIYGKPGRPSSTKSTVPAHSQLTNNRQALAAGDIRFNTHTEICYLTNQSSDFINAYSSLTHALKALHRENMPFAPTIMFKLYHEQSHSIGPIEIAVLRKTLEEWLARASVYDLKKAEASLLNTPNLAPTDSELSDTDAASLTSDDNAYLTPPTTSRNRYELFNYCPAVLTSPESIDPELNAGLFPQSIGK